MKSCCLNSDKMEHVNFCWTILGLDKTGLNKMGRSTPGLGTRQILMPPTHYSYAENNFYAVTSTIKEKVKFLPFKPFEFQICATPNEESRQQASPPLKVVSRGQTLFRTEGEGLGLGHRATCRPAPWSAYQSQHSIQSHDT